MGAREFGRRIDAEMQRQGIGAMKLAARIGELSDGRAFDATGIRLMRQGRRQQYDAELVERIANALGIDLAEAFFIAGVWPPGLTTEHIRHLELFAARRQAVAPGAARAQGEPGTLYFYVPAGRAAA